MKKNFFKFLLLGALTFAVGAGFVGCKDYEDDINDLETRISAAESSIADIRAQLGAKTVKDVTAEGEGKIKVTYTDNTTATVTVSTNGTGATPVGTLRIGDNGNWFNGDTDLNIPVYPGNPRVSSDGKFWEFPTVQNGAVVYVKSTLPASPYIVRNENGTISLWINAKGETQLQEINLLTAVNAIGKIDILGWITGKGAADEAISPSGATGAAVLETVNDFDVHYAYIADFKWAAAEKAAGDGTSDGDATDSQTGLNSPNRVPNSWTGGKHNFGRGVVLNTLSAEPKGLLIQIHPATAVLPDNLSLVASDGTVLPIGFGKPQLVTGLLTKAAAPSALYFIPGDNTSETFASEAVYLERFQTDAVYSLAAGASRISEYTAFTFTASTVASEEAAVADVLVAATDVAAAKVTASGNTVFSVKTNEAYKIDFAPITTLSDGPANGEAVIVDYYIEPTDLSQFVTGKFSVEFSADKTEFTVKRLPDDLTLAFFDLNVYKLGVDGLVYMETIRIRPVRTGLTTTIDLGNYLITDESNAASPWSSKSVTIDLKPMFDALKLIVASDGTNLADRWQDPTYGALTYTIPSATIDGVEQTSAPSATFTKLMANPSLFEGYSNANGTGTMSTGGVDVYNTRSIKLNPRYSTTGTGTANATFTPDAQYVFTIEFQDGDGDYMNTLIIKFKPVLPPVADLFEKAPAQWTADLSTLNAYYKTPLGTEAAAGTPSVVSYFYTAAPTDVTTFPAILLGTAVTATYYNVLSPATPAHAAATPADGGFVRFGGKEGEDNMWLKSVALAIEGPARINNAATNTLAAAGSPSIIVLANQTTTPSKVDLTAADAYGQTLEMGVTAGAYLDTYTYSATQLDAVNFKMKVMSALAEGRLDVAPGVGTLTFDAASVGEVFYITDAHISGYNYDGGKYSLFRNTTNTWAYQYIRSVEFTNPGGVHQPVYTIVNGVNNNASSEETWSAGAGMKNLGVAIRADNITQDWNTLLHVKVTDRFGKVIEADIPFTIKRRNP